jgi:hypothetical protein
MLEGGRHTLVSWRSPVRPVVTLEVTGQLLTTVGDNPERMRSEAAFAHLCGVAPIPANTG